MYLYHYGDWILFRIEMRCNVLYPIHKLMNDPNEVEIVEEVVVVLYDKKGPI
jgi:hypothetical protein